jgi:hypothetical protein
MFATLQCVVLDCSNVLELARFYHALVGGTVNKPDPRWGLSDRWATLHLDHGLVLAFQRADNYQPPTWPDPTRPQQFHLDFGVPDLPTAEAQVLALGGNLLDSTTDHRGWRIYADPAGHPFCLVRHG